MSLLTVGCNQNKENEICRIPVNIENYIIDHTNKFKFIDADEFTTATLPFVEKNDCVMSAIGDFDRNGMEDFALIVRYQGYRINNEAYINYDFPFLMIFNNYKVSSLSPHLVHKTDDYVDEYNSTVIYHQQEEGIWAFIRSGIVCNKEVVEIPIPEKSTFYVYWNRETQKYHYINHLDENLCERIAPTKAQN